MDEFENQVQRRELFGNKEFHPLQFPCFGLYHNSSALHSALDQLACILGGLFLQTSPAYSIVPRLLAGVFQHRASGGHPRAADAKFAQRQRQPRSSQAGAQQHSAESPALTHSSRLRSRVPLWPVQKLLLLPVRAWASFFDFLQRSGSRIF